MTKTHMPKTLTPKTPTPKTRLIFSLALFTTLAVIGCVEEIIDPSFQNWCGDTLCDWDVEAGRIARVGTWHPSDYGVELLDTPTILSQVTGTPTSDLYDRRGFQVPEAQVEALCAEIDGLYLPDTNDCISRVSGGRPGCLRFEVIADVDSNAQVQIEVDYGADGTVDHTQPMVASNWEPVSFLTSVPTWPGLMRFRMHKRGPGRAVIAQFGVRTDTECVDPVTVEERPLGVACEQADQCASNVCADVVSWQACSECADDLSCDAGETCQVQFDDEHPNGAYRACRTAP